MAVDQCITLNLLNRRAAQLITETVTVDVNVY